MKTGIVIFAHNSQELEYTRMALISGSLAKKYLKVPICLITDNVTLESIQNFDYYNDIKEVFDQIISIDQPSTDNTRVIYEKGDYKKVPFINDSRSSIWELTPYDRTLLIDSDYLIFSDALSHYWEVDSDIMIAESMVDVSNERKGLLDYRISDTSIQMYWATTVMFTKNSYTKHFFDLVQYIKENYVYFAAVYKFNTRPFRNDIAFSIAKHIMDGFKTSEDINLPPILTTLDRDSIIAAKNNSLKFILQGQTDECTLIDLSDQDLHCMNKKTITDNYDLLMELI